MKLTKPREYYPPEDKPLELGPTEGCTEAIKCLKMHCQLLKGSTSKEVLEVFYQEIGIRLIALVDSYPSTKSKELTYFQHSAKAHQTADYLAKWWFSDHCGPECVSCFYYVAKGRITTYWLQRNSPDTVPGPDDRSRVLVSQDAWTCLCCRGCEGSRTDCP